MQKGDATQNPCGLQSGENLWNVGSSAKASNRPQPFAYEESKDVRHNPSFVVCGAESHLHLHCCLYSVPSPERLLTHVFNTVFGVRGMASVGHWN